MKIRPNSSLPGMCAIGVVCCALNSCGGPTPTGPAPGPGFNDGSGSAGAAGALPSAGVGGAIAGASGAVAGAPGAGAASVAGSAGMGGVGTGGASGSGGAAGMAGSSGMSGGAGTAGASAGCNGAALCDSFERTVLGPDWTLDNSTSSTVIELVTTQAHTGMSSVHIKFGTTTLQSYITHKLLITGKAYWGRAWIFTMLTPVGHSIYIEARVAAGNDKSGVRSLNTFDGKGSMGLNLESSDASKNSSTTLSGGKWVCYEWQVEGIGGAGDFTTWVDGVPMPAGKVANGVTPTVPLSGTIPALTRQRIGIQRYDAGAAGEMWIDDVAIGDTRINCTP